MTDVRYPARFLILAFLICIPSFAYATPEHYDSWASFSKAHPALNGAGYQVPSFVRDLNEDGIPDKIVLLLRDKGHAQIFVLSGRMHEGFDVTGKSNVFEYGGYSIGDGWVTQIEKSAKNGFYVTFAAKSGYDGFSTYTFRFGLRDGVWRLIGQDVDYEGTGDNTKKQTLSVDFLTGYFTFKSVNGGKIIKTRHGKRDFPVLLMRNFNYYEQYGFGGFWD